MYFMCFSWVVCSINGAWVGCIFLAVKLKMPHICLFSFVAVVVLQGATVNDLIKAFEREVLRRCKRSGKTTYISW